MSDRADALLMHIRSLPFHSKMFFLSFIFLMFFFQQFPVRGQCQHVGKQSCTMKPFLTSKSIQRGLLSLLKAGARVKTSKYKSSASMEEKQLIQLFFFFFFFLLLVVSLCERETGKTVRPESEMWLTQSDRMIILSPMKPHLYQSRPPWARRPANSPRGRPTVKRETLDSRWQRYETRIRAVGRAFTVMIG